MKRTGFHQHPPQTDWNLYHVPANRITSQSPSTEVTSTPSKTKKGARGQRAALYVFIAVMVVSGVALAVYGLQTLRAKQATAALRALYYTTAAPTDASASAALPAESQASPAPSSVTLVSWFVTDPPAEGSSPVAVAAAQTSAPPAGSTPTADPQLEALRLQNPDIIGWLNIPDLLDEPVVQRDNTTYLSRDALGNESITGALFLDERCALSPASQNLMIHGHNMKTGAMFGCLKKYEVQGASFLKTHGLLALRTLYGQAAYAVFAVMVVDTQPNQPLYFSSMEQIAFATETDFQNYLQTARRLSLYSVPLDVQSGDRLLTLSTCEGADNEQRLMVLARQVRPDETTTQLIYSLSQAAVNVARLR
ncbi:MAG TPA: class B sortase [Candidatus Limiplasma sp.]|nr:class B sortase [Candidatus Limiplasma sp.]HPS80611.1 class B sortase [Candidatus Limiplasma sp.]